jgi:hypothetical protein
MAAHGSAQRRTAAGAAGELLGGRARQVSAPICRPAAFRPARPALQGPAGPRWIGWGSKSRILGRNGLCLFVSSVSAALRGRLHRRPAAAGSPAAASPKCFAFPSFLKGCFWIRLLSDGSQQIRCACHWSLFGHRWVDSLHDDVPRAKLLLPRPSSQLSFIHLSFVWRFQGTERARYTHISNPPSDTSSEVKEAVLVSFRQHPADPICLPWTLLPRPPEYRPTERGI